MLVQELGSLMTNKKSMNEVFRMGEGDHGVSKDVGL